MVPVNVARLLPWEIEARVHAHAEPPPQVCCEAGVACGARAGFRQGSTALERLLE